MIAFLRESHAETILVVLSRNAAQFNISLIPFGYEVEKVLYGSGQIGAVISRNDVEPSIGIYQLSRC